MTGQVEILDLCRRLREAFPRKAKASFSAASRAAETKPDKPDPVAAVDGNLDSDEDEEDDFAGDEKASALAKNMQSFADAGGPNLDTEEALHVLPLYSSLSAREQAKVFAAAPPGSRMCVVATNVAETSLTIPNVRYVVDTGMVKALHSDAETGVIRFDVEWTSKASVGHWRRRSVSMGRAPFSHLTTVGSRFFNLFL